MLTDTFSKYDRYAIIVALHPSKTEELRLAVCESLKRAIQLSHNEIATEKLNAFIQGRSLSQ
jgi:hypothetical protein